MRRKKNSDKEMTKHLSKYFEGDEINSIVVPDFRKHPSLDRGLPILATKTIPPKKPQGD